MNYATELRIAYSDGVKEVLERDPDTIDPKKYGAIGKAHVKAFVMDKMKNCGCAGKAV